MTENYPPEATPEQKGMPRSFFNPFPLPIEITEQQSKQIAFESKTYGG